MSRNVLQGMSRNVSQGMSQAVGVARRGMRATLSGDQTKGFIRLMADRAPNRL